MAKKKKTNLIKERPLGKRVIIKVTTKRSKSEESSLGNIMLKKETTKDTVTNIVVALSNSMLSLGEVSVGDKVRVQPDTGFELKDVEGVENQPDNEVYKVISYDMIQSVIE